ncbi:MAG: PepSY domain-containing protein [Methylococcaceae bacterium]|nr:PepSY domain-containing protein [Methylococcaceae bacterium]
MNRWLTRKLWLNVHLYLALVVGFIFAIIGLTGSISVYREELDALLNPQLVVENPQGEFQSLDRIMAAVRNAHPDRYGEWTLEMPSSPNGMVTVWFEKPKETFFERYAPLMVSVNPYTAEVVANRFWGRTITTWLLDWHTHLHYDEMGWNIVGYCGALLIVSVLSGIYLWWPGVKNISSVLQVRVRLGLIRLVFDLHRVMGLCSAGALLILAFTGFQLSFPSLLEEISGSSGMAHGGTGESISSTAIPNDHPTVLEAAEFVARGPFQTAELRRVTTPMGDSGVYRVNLRQKGEINHRHPYTTVWVDRWSGQIREVRDPKSFSTGQKVITWMWPLHTGEALGSIGRFCWFLAGQSLFFLYVSGLMRWLHSKGWIKDRAIHVLDSTEIKLWIKNAVYRLLVVIDRMMNWLARKGAPLVVGMVNELSKWFEKGLGLYLSKIKK